MKPETIALRQVLRPARVRRAGEESYPLLSMTMRNGLVDQRDKFKKRVASVDTSAYKVAHRGQLVVGFPIDEGVLAFQELYEDAIVSPAYEIWDVADPTAVNRRYLERYLRCPQALRYYAGKLRGTTARRRSLPRDVFLDLPVPVPSMRDQERIAEMLDDADDLRVKRRLALLVLDELSQSTFVDMFGDPLTNPKRWLRRHIGEIGKVATGNTPPRANKSFFGDVVEWIKSDNISPPHMYLTQALEGLSDEGAHVARLAEPDSLLVTCIAGSPSSIGNVAIANRRVAFNQQINAFTPHKGELLFWYMQLRVGKRLIQNKSTGGMKGIVSKSRFEEIELMLPPLELQAEFAERLVEIQSIRAAASSQAAQLDGLFDALRDLAFRGEL